MKTLTNFFRNAPLLVLAFLIASCANVTKPDPIAHISGEITNPAGVNVSFKSEAGLWETELQDGKFELEIPIEEAASGQIKIGPEYALMYVQPGDKIHITLDAELFDETINFEGSPASNYIAAKLLAEEQSMEDPTDNPYLMELTGYEAHINASRDRNKTLLANARSELPKSFAAAEEKEIEMEWALMRARYPEFHAYYAKDASFSVDDSYWDFVKDFDLNDPANLESDKFMGFASLYLSSKGASLVPDNASATDKSMAMMDLIDNNFSNEEIKQSLYETAITNYIAEFGAQGAQPLYERFMAVCKDDECVTRVTELYNDWARLVQGKTAPAFAYQDINGKRVALDDLQGKVVYIDVWATWCGPCKREMPYLEAMQEEMADRSDIVFASISVDEDKEAWEKMVTEKKMKGLQLYADGAFKSDICRDYLIDGIPRFIIINKDGTIENANAPRPSTGEEIEKALKKAAERKVAMR